MDCPRPTTGLEGCNIHPWITAFQSWFLSIQHCHLVITVILALFLNFSHASDAPLRWVACSAILARPTNLSLTLIPTKIILSFHPCSFLLSYNTLHWLEFASGEASSILMRWAKWTGSSSKQIFVGSKKIFLWLNNMCSIQFILLVLIKYDQVLSPVHSQQSGSVPPRAAAGPIHPHWNWLRRPAAIAWLRAPAGRRSDLGWVESCTTPPLYPSLSLLHSKWTRCSES